MPRKKPSPSQKSTRSTYKPRKTPEERMRQLATKRGKNQEPVWDLDRDGITYSALAKFGVCKERMRLSTVEGWSQTGLEAALEFGSAFHKCLENTQETPQETTARYQRQRIQDRAVFPNQLEEFECLMGMVEAMAEAYRKVYAQEDRESKNFLYVEHAFDVTYDLTACDQFDPRLIPPFVTVRPIRLRGRWDGVYEDKHRDLWLFETKTKSDIDQLGISRTLSQDLQTMLYVTSIELVTGRRVKGVLYNVIRRPALRLGKNETLRNFITRVRDTALEQSEKYFLRWPHTLDKNDLKKWQVATLNPLLMQLLIWWDSIKANPFQPQASPYHNQMPFGIYNSLASGRRGDFFELLTGGGVSGLKRRTTPFPELVDGD